jgi:hypothetical protein
MSVRANVSWTKSRGTKLNKTLDEPNSCPYLTTEAAFQLLIGLSIKAKKAADMNVDILKPMLKTFSNSIYTLAK